MRRAETQKLLQELAKGRYEDTHLMFFFVIAMQNV